MTDKLARVTHKPKTHTYAPKKQPEPVESFLHVKDRRSMRWCLFAVFKA